MARQLDFTGKSGQLYRYTLLEEGHPMWPSGGNFLYVRGGEKGPEVLFAGEAESLFRGYDARWEEAKSHHGATQIFLRLNISGAVRRAEQEDIVAQHQPPMNAGGAAAEPKRARKAQ